MGRRLVREVKDARWESVAGASSGMWEEQPDAVAESLTRWMSTQ